ncbi:MAG: L,D-transpeptidase family protein [Phycisphaera sp.]|nr:L,D-transpeptidase family protein [Phycisphaera sp.]
MSWKQRQARRMRRVIGVVLLIVAALVAWSWNGEDEKATDATTNGEAMVDSGAVPTDALAATTPEPSRVPEALRDHNGQPMETPAAILARATAERNAAAPNAATSSPVTTTPAPTAPTPSDAVAQQPIVNPNHPAIDKSGDDTRTTALLAATSPARAAPQPTAATNTGGGSLLNHARQLAQQGQLVEARDILNKALNGPITPGEASAIRADMQALNEELVFSPKIVPNDPYAEAYVVKPGELVSKIAARYDVPWQFICYINGNLDPRRLRAGARLKVVKGPFHAVVDKSDFRLDIYLGDMYCRSFNVGLGEHGSTPLGTFQVKQHSKLEHPVWVNPRTGEKFAANDPQNPLGGYWIGLEGTDENTRDLAGYGIHGTIHPESIGHEASMGCVRLIPDQVKIVYLMLLEEKSKVAIVQ